MQHPRHLHPSLHCLVELHRCIPGEQLPKLPVAQVSLPMAVPKSPLWRPQCGRSSGNPGGGALFSLPGEIA